MTISSPGKAVNPREKAAKLKGDTTVEAENNQGQSSNLEESTKMPVQEKSSNKLQVREKGAIAGARPPGASDLEVSEKLSMVGVRPVGVSHLEVAETFNAMGIRPIGANTMHVVGTMNQSGVRPIGSSAIIISETYSVMGNRPVAPNETGDSEILMGFLD
jgi:hypothetical protein